VFRFIAIGIVARPIGATPEGIPDFVTAVRFLVSEVATAVSAWTYYNVVGAHLSTHNLVAAESPHKHPSLTTTDYHDGSRSWQHGAAAESPHKHPSLTTTDYHDGSRSWQHGAAVSVCSFAGDTFVLLESRGRACGVAGSVWR
jgi:hypothetical protein